MPRKDIIDALRSYIELFRVTQATDFHLKNFDPGDTCGLKMNKGEAAQLLQRESEWLAMEQDILYAQDSWSLLLVFQATDAAGKDGTIKHVMSGVNPQGCDVFSFGAALVLYTLSAFFWMKSQGASDQLVRTAAVNAITLGQVFYLLNSRYLLDSSLSVRAHMGNPYLWYGIAAVVLLQLLFTYALPFHAIFDTEALPMSDWLWLVGGAIVFFLVVEVEKLVIRSIPAFRASVTAEQMAADMQRG